jgi:hypothetical protein
VNPEGNAGLAKKAADCLAGVGSILRAMALSDRDNHLTPEWPARRGPGWGAVAAVLILALASAASSLFTLERLKNAVLAAVDAGRPAGLPVLWASLGATDAALAALSAAALVFLIYLEWSRRIFSRFLVSATPAQSFAILTIIVAWLGQAYLFPGVLLGGDSGSHVARFLEVREGLAAGSLPQWTNFDYLGSPLLGFTGPLLYVVGGALDLLVRDPVATAKILLFATHLAAGWAFYALLLRLGIARTAALFAAIGFAGSFAALHLFLYRGVFPQAFTILFLVLIFYAAEGIMRAGGLLWRDWLIFALSVGGMIINHQPHALFAALYLGLYGSASLALGRWDWKRLWALITAGVVGVGISLVAVVPVIAESSWVMIDPEGGLFRFHLPTWQRLSDLVIWRDTRTTWGIDYWAYLGIVLVGLAIAGGFASWRGRLGHDRRPLALAVAPGLMLSFFVYNPVVRDIIFILFFTGILAALGFEWLAQTVRPASRLPLVVAAALLLDVAGTSVQPVARSDKAFLIEAGRYLAQTAPEERFAEIDLARDGSIQADIGPDAGPLSAYAMVQRVAGHHNMAATPVHNYAETIVEMVARDLRRDGRVGDPTLALLRLLNVSRIVCISPVAAGCPDGFVQARVEGPLGRVIHIADASPVLFSRHLATLPPPARLDKPMLWPGDFEGDAPSPQISGIEDFLDRYLRGADIAWASHQAAALPVRAVPPESPAPAENDPWQAALGDYSVSLQTVSLRITASGKGYAQLSHPWYPATEVRLNGKAITPLQGAFDLMVVPLQPGINDIEIGPVTTPVRRYSALASAASLVLACLIAALLAFRARRRRRAA